MTDALSQALNYIEEHSEPELLEMALKHTSFNAWISELCKKAHDDGVTVACSLYIRPLARFLEEQRTEMRQAVRVEPAGDYGDTELVSSWSGRSKDRRTPQLPLTPPGVAFTER